MLREVVDQNCVGGISCASARAAGVDFQACLIDRSSISPFRINHLRAVWNSIAQNLPSRIFDSTTSTSQLLSGHAFDIVNTNCVRPSNVARSLTAVWSRRFSDDAIRWLEPIHVN
jgi:hypothetical protein